MNDIKICIGSKYRYRLHQYSTGKLLVDCIVEIVKQLNENTCRFKVCQVLKDDSGNNYYTYICNSGKEENGSCKYLSEV